MFNIQSMTVHQRVRIIAVASILVYTIIRFFFVKITLESYGVNPWIFLIIDATTGIVYVMGIEYLILWSKGKEVSWVKLFIASGVTAASFAAPYAYIYMWSHELPPGITVGLGLIILILLVNACFGVWRRMRSSRIR